MWGQIPLPNWITVDNGLIFVGTFVALLLAWTFMRRRLHFKMPRKWVIGLCVVLSIALHGALLLWLPHLPGNGHGGFDSASSPQANALAVVAVDTLETEDVEDSQDEGDGDEPMHTPPLPAAIPSLPEVQPEVSQSPPAPPALASARDLNAAATQAVDQMLSELLLADASNAASVPVPPMVSLPQAAPSTSNSGVEDRFRVPQQTLQGYAMQGSGNIASLPTARPAPGQVPHDFSNRQGQARLAAVYNGGGDERTEAAVTAALSFLASAQEADGRWSAARYGAGKEEQVFGQTRNGAGRNADTGVTGLALLAMLGRGTTLQDPQHGASLARGLQYLGSIQQPDGSLAGGADAYAAMYSHGIASLAMVEAYAMTGDPTHRHVAQAALAYTVRSQHPTTGGWRYFPGDTGDLSQFGWQAMALQTGIWAGLPVPESVHPKMATFLRSVRGGTYGGLASYRPGERPSASMTAEALASRLLLGQSVSEAEAQEAEAYLLSERPGIGRDNHYFWYYASIALHQRGSPAWEEWNRAMKSRVLATQLTDGSWSTDSLWGGYGGSIYTTSVAALCLEVYYRHLAIHRGGTSVATQPGESVRSMR